MPSQPYNVGIVGYGMSAKVFHIPLLDVVPEFKLYGIVQRVPKPGNDAEKDHPDIKSYRFTEQMVKDSKVDVVVVSTTPQTHFELTKLALENGKHVVVEKPFTPTTQEADELMEIAKRNNRLLTVYHSRVNGLSSCCQCITDHPCLLDRRWDSDFLTILNLIEHNTLGRIVEFETHFDRHRPELPPGGGWKTESLPGGGTVYDLGTHLIDQVVQAFGLPKRITGFVGSQREENPGGYEDACTVLLHYDGLLATVKAGVVSPEKSQLRYWLYPPLHHQLHIYSPPTAHPMTQSNLAALQFHVDPQEDHLKAGLTPSSPGFGREPPARNGTLITIQSSGELRSEPWPNLMPPLTYKAFYDQFAQALNRRAEVPVKPEDAREVIRLVELARRSSRECRTLVV
ncbi:MAG: hypothetical protein Q9191_002546 [Dirinaria sp. TL-2023a]